MATFSIFECDFYYHQNDILSLLRNSNMFIWLNVMLLMTKESNEVSFIDLVSNVTLFWDTLFNHIMDRYIMTFCDSIFWLLSKNPNFIFDSWFTQICKKKLQCRFSFVTNSKPQKKFIALCKYFWIPPILHLSNSIYSIILNFITNKGLNFTYVSIGCT